MTFRYFISIIVFSALLFQAAAQQGNNVNTHPTAGASSGERGSNGTGARDATGTSRIILSGQSVDTLDILYDVDMIPQTTGMSCWAAAAAMVVGWRDDVILNPDEIAAGIGYWAQYSSGGLPPADTTMFSYWGLYTEPIREYSVQNLATLLWEYGPIWVATAELGPHIRVVRGIHGDGTPDGTVLYINDPWQHGMTRFFTPNLGSVYVETVTEFLNHQRRLVEGELARSINGFYIAHP